MISTITSTRHEENLHILEKFLKVVPWPEKEGDHDDDEGVFYATSFPSKDNVKGVEERVHNMAKNLAMIALRGWMFTFSTTNEGGGEEEEEAAAFPKAITTTLFEAFADFILTIYDTEDFERHIYENSRLREEYERFYAEKLSTLNDDIDNPFELIARGEINLDGFPLLREQDVGTILCLYLLDINDGIEEKGHEDVPMHIIAFGRDEGEGVFLDKRDDVFVDMARSVMLHHVPVKEEFRVHANLEALHLYQCACASTSLLLEARTVMDNKEELLRKHITSDRVRAELCLLFEDVVSFAISDRSETLRLSTSMVTNALKDSINGQFGFFTDEVFDLIHIADARRKAQAHRFISKHHILWAVGLTRIKDCVDKLIEALGMSRNSVEEPATVPPYSVYMLARRTADIHGVEEVGIEHVVIATIFEMCMEKLGKSKLKRKNLKAFNRNKCVKNFLVNVSVCMNNMLYK